MISAPASRWQHPERNRKLLRLKNYDYSTDGAYFVTICAQNHEHFFGEIENRNGQKFLTKTAIGKIAEKCWQEIPDHFPDTKLDESIVMPNHIHGIIWIENEIKNRDRPVGNAFVGNKIFCSLPRERRETKNKIPWQTKLSRSLSSIIRGFKIGVTKWCHDKEQKNLSLDFAWQKSFHDRIIRDDAELNRIRDYIFLNPENWETDRNNLK